MRDYFDLLLEAPRVDGPFVTAPQRAGALHALLLGEPGPLDVGCNCQEWAFALLNIRNYARSHRLDDTPGEVFMDGVRVVGPIQLNHTSEFQLDPRGQIMRFQATLRYPRLDGAAVSEGMRLEVEPFPEVVRLGEEVDVTFNLTTLAWRHWSQVVIPLPAGLEPLPREQQALRDWSVAIYTDKVVLGTSSLSGSTRLTLRTRAVRPGRYLAPGLLAEEIYDPKNRAVSEDRWVEVIA